jgi:N-acetylneuraminate lyase
MIQRTEGLIAAPFTPMTADGSVALGAIEKQAGMLARNGVIGAFVCGTTGEGASLSTAERMDVARRWVEAAPKNFRVIIHVGHASLAEAKALAAHAQKAGAWGIGAMAPYFFRPRRVEDLVACCREVAAAAPALPFYYYHMPSMSGVTFAMADFLEAAADRIPTLVGLKFTYENLMDFGLCLRMASGRFDVLFGRDEILLSALALGGRGAVGTTYNFAAPLYLRIIEAFKAGDMKTAADLQMRAVEMIRILARAGGGSAIPSGKAVMKMIGIDCGPVRLPIVGLQPDECERLKTDLERIGFFEYCCK